MLTDEQMQLNPERIYQAITDGVHQAIWQMITSATSMPGHDFYDAVQEGIRSAITDVAIRAEAK